jgi:hypothetical protein
MQCRFAWALTALVCVAPAIRAEHGDIDLRVIRLDPQTGVWGEDCRATADQEPPQGGRRQRPVFKVKAGEPLLLQFFLTNTYPHGEKKNVTVRYFIVREAKAGQKAVPSLKEGVVTQGKFTLNFKPKCRVGARVAFSAPAAGVYLIRVQTENSDSDHEHISGIDLQVD